MIEKTSSFQDVPAEIPGSGRKKKAKNYNVKDEHKAWLNILAVLFFLYSLTLIFPLLWMLYNAMKSRMEFFVEPWAWPQDIIGNLSNFTIVFQEFGLAEMFFNTVFLSVLSPLITLFCTTSAAYAYAKHKFRGRGLLYAIAMVPMVVTIAGTQPATYRLVNNLGIYDNLGGILLLSTGGFGINFLLVASVFINISDSYREAASIDGAGNWRIFLTIYVPQASNLLIALYVLSFIGTWNDYMTPYLYLPSHQTLATGIYTLSERLTTGNDKYSNDYPKLFASMLLSILPVLVIFAAFQDKIMKFQLGGGIKG